jgi:hypothetical protein
MVAPFLFVKPQERHWLRFVAVLESKGPAWRPATRDNMRCQAWRRHAAATPAGVEQASNRHWAGVEPALADIGKHRAA